MTQDTEPYTAQRSIPSLTPSQSSQDGAVESLTAYWDSIVDTSYQTVSEYLPYTEGSEKEKALVKSSIISLPFYAAGGIAGAELSSMATSKNWVTAFGSWVGAGITGTGMLAAKYMSDNASAYSTSINDYTETIKDIQYGALPAKAVKMTAKLGTLYGGLETGMDPWQAALGAEVVSNTAFITSLPALAQATGLIESTDERTPAEDPRIAAVDISNYQETLPDTDRLIQRDDQQPPMSV